MGDDKGGDEDEESLADSDLQEGLPLHHSQITPPEHALSLAAITPKGKGKGGGGGRTVSDSQKEGESVFVSQQGNNNKAGQVTSKQWHSGCRQVTFPPLQAKTTTIGRREPR